MKKNKRIVIFGFGSIARKYVRLIKKHFPNVEVFIICSSKINIYKESNLIDGYHIDHSKIKELNPDGIVIAVLQQIYLVFKLSSLNIQSPISIV